MSTFLHLREYFLSERMQAQVLSATATGMDAPEECARILAAAKAGDLAAFEQLMRRYERLVLVTALRLLGNLADAQDVAQDVFLKLHRNLKKMEATENFAGWLYRVTVNLCRDRQRRALSAVELPEIPGTCPDPQQELMEGERRRVLEMSLRMLPYKERAALVLRDLEGLATSEVAHILGSSEATVRSQIRKARMKVKDFVKRYFRGRV